MRRKTSRPSLAGTARGRITVRTADPNVAYTAAAPAMNTTILATIMGPPLAPRGARLAPCAGNGDDNGAFPVPSREGTVPDVGTDWSPHPDHRRDRDRGVNDARPHDPPGRRSI